MRDPNVLYSTIAQINATIVAILGGFLLTYGLARVAEMRRIKRHLRAALQTVGEANVLQRSIEDEHGAIEADLEQGYRETYRQMLAGRLTPAEVEQARARLREAATARTDAIGVQLDTMQRRLTADAATSRRLRHALTDQEFEIKEVAAGLIILLIVAVVGVAMPIAELPSSPIAETGWREWFVQRLFLLSLGAVMIYVFAVTVAEPSPVHSAAASPAWPTRLWRRFGLNAIVVAGVIVLVFVPGRTGFYVLIVLLILALVTVIARLRRRKDPDDLDGDELATLSGAAPAAGTAPTTDAP